MKNTFETIVNNLVELTGTEKQVNYFDDEEKINVVVNLFNRAKSAKFWIEEIENKGVLSFQLGRILSTKAY